MWWKLKLSVHITFFPGFVLITASYLALYVGLWCKRQPEFFKLMTSDKCSCKSLLIFFSYLVIVIFEHCMSLLMLFLMSDPLPVVLVQIHLYHFFSFCINVWHIQAMNVRVLLKLMHAVRWQSSWYCINHLCSCVCNCHLVHLVSESFFM